IPLPATSSTASTLRSGSRDCAPCRWSDATRPSGAGERAAFMARGYPALCRVQAGRAFRLALRRSVFNNAPVLDIKLIREKPDFVRQRLATRGPGNDSIVDKILQTDEQRR